MTLSDAEWRCFSNIIHAFNKFSLIEMLNGIVKNLSSTPHGYRFDVNDALENVGSLYTLIQCFVSSTPGFRVLDINEQRCLFEHNLHGIGSMYIHLTYRDAEIFENDTTYQTYTMVY